MKAMTGTGNGVEIAGSTTSASSAIDTTGATHLLVVTGAFAVAYVALGRGSAPTATTADLPCASYYPTLIPLPAGGGVTHVAAILNSGTGDVAVCPVQVGTGV